MIAKLHSCERSDHFVKRSRDLESPGHYESLWSIWTEIAIEQLLSIQFDSSRSACCDKNHLSRSLLSFLRLKEKQRANSRDPSCLCVDSSRGHEFCSAGSRPERQWPFLPGWITSGTGHPDHYTQFINHSCAPNARFDNGSGKAGV